jgi:hypothetical protein
MGLPAVVKGKTARPRRVLLYGTHGIGKSTWASGAESPLVLATEDGLDDIGVDRSPLLRSTQELGRWLIELGGEEDHGYRTVVIDTLDWAEQLIQKATCEEHNKKSIEEFGYGKGYTLCLPRWKQLLLWLDCCRNRGMNVVLLAHARIERFSPPDGDPYDRWQPDLHKTVSPLLQEWADEILFATYKVNTISTDEGFGKTRARAIGDGERVVYTCELPTHAAKRRIELPNELPLDWTEYRKHWPTNGNIKNVVVDGSSKKKEKVNG